MKLRTIYYGLWMRWKVYYYIREYILEYYPVEMLIIFLCM